MIPDLDSYDYIVINTSAGKDSQAMMDYLFELATDLGIVSRLVAVHADLGRMEWSGTSELAERQADCYGIRFEKIKRPQGDILEHVEKRGMWPSSTTRYCTSDHKRGQVGKIITMLTREVAAIRDIKLEPVRILNCMGLRAEESPARAKKVPFSRLKRLTTQSRIVDEWLPILSWKVQDVWSRIRESEVEHHPAYDIGMPRLSCVFCIFAPKNALVLAGKHNRELLNEYVQVERKIEHRFRVDVSIEEIRELVLADAPVGSMTDAWNM